MLDRASVLCGIGCWLPPRVVTNDDLTRTLDTSDEWIRTRTGIRERHVVDPGMSTGDLAVAAGRAALHMAATKATNATNAVDTVVLATTTPDMTMPGTASEVAHRLGLGTVAAFDVNAACSGFVYGLAVAGGLVASGAAENVLMIGADAFSTVLDPHDRTTRALMADGAGAVVLRAGRADEPGALIDVDLGSDGEHADLLTIPGTGSRQRSSGTLAPLAETYFTMRGPAVFGNAVIRMTESVQAVLKKSGWTVEDIDVLVPHQANQRILDSVGNQLGIEADRVVSAIAGVGNTGAASIPLALLTAIERGTLRAGQRVVLTAFGAGLSWGSITLTWPQLDVHHNTREKS